MPEENLTSDDPRQLEIYDAAESERLKQKGMDISAKSRKQLLRDARKIAVDLAHQNMGLCNADDVGRYALEVWEVDLALLLGPAMGSLFKDKKVWQFTGERVKSSRVKNHSREIKVWRLRKWAP